MATEFHLILSFSVTSTFPCAAVEADQNKTEESENSFSTFSIFPLKFRIRTAKMNVPVFIDISIEEQVNPTFYLRSKNA